MPDFVVSEVLCYVQNHYGSSTRENMVTALTGCYCEEEIVTAKLILFGIADNLPEKPDNLPRLIKRQAGDGKKLSDCRDLVALYKELDLHKVELPQFVAANLSRVPTVKPGEVDIYYMAVNIANLTLQLEKISARLAVLEGAKPSCLPTSIPADSSTVPSTPNLPILTQPNGPTPNRDSW